MGLKRSPSDLLAHTFYETFWIRVIDPTRLGMHHYGERLLTFPAHCRDDEWTHIKYLTSSEAYLLQAY
jgi:hypothetical protein